MKKSATKVDQASMEILVERLIELGNLTIVNPNEHRKQFQVDDATWNLIKKYANEQINGREWKHTEEE